MGLLELMKEDANLMTTDSDDGFAEPVTFIAPSGMEVTVNALHTKHHLGFDIQKAQEINTMKGHVCVAEKELTDLGYPVRNSVNEVSLMKHKIKAKDANGLLWTYKVAQFFPNDKVGTISIILGSYDPQ